MQTEDLSRRLQIEILKSISTSIKIDACEKESRFLLEFNPQYAIYYLREKQLKKNNG
jgi:hypothetical protein